MPTALKISRMTIAEKLRTMEELWDELCRQAGDSLAAPAWHGEVLKQREESLRDGKDKPVEWETAKKRIRKAVS